jgi:putative endonuclease
VKKNIKQFLPLHLRRGNDAEELAEKYLVKKGLSLIRRNYHCKAGEIDLIMQDAGILVFVEVRYRSNPFFGSAAESITAKKMQRCRKTADHYLQYQHLHRHLYKRFDVIAITALQTKQEILWIKDAF